MYLNNNLFNNKYRNSFLLVASLAWLYIYLYNTSGLHFLTYWHFSLLGTLGAIIANSTGAGGGIVFIPFFSALGMHAQDSLGTSILIQCFGMTAGSISWILSSQIMTINSSHITSLTRTLLLFTSISCITGVLLGQYFVQFNHSESLLLTFRMFSIFFGIILIYLSVYKAQSAHTRYQMTQVDYLVIFMASFVGAIITAWISVGIGEVIAVTLILLRFPTMVAITVGVCMSSLAVLTAAYQHIAILDSVSWNIVLFAGPGAIIGGSIAYLFSQKLGAKRLKLVFGVWIIATGFII